MPSTRRSATVLCGLALSSSSLLAQGPGRSVVEEFDSFRNLDLIATGANWGGERLTPGRLGDSGVLGDFVAADGRLIGQVGGITTWEWSTDNQVIPASRTLTGQAITVTDGVFRFASFVLLPDERVVFVGSRPVQIRVAGAALVFGIIDVSGVSTQPGFNGRQAGATTGRGQVGALGGPGGGSGGAGGNRPGLALPVDGEPGADVQVAPGHPYFATRVGTGGLGSTAMPPGGTGTINYCRSNTFSMDLNAGGSGGGLWAGRPATAGTVSRPFPPCVLGPATPAGASFQILPEVASVSSLVQFVIGGAGGGGGGTNPYLSIRAQAPSWNTGAAGAGGGGALVLRAGLGVGVLASGQLVARGGSSSNPSNVGYATAGAGGSGGSILIQAPFHYLGGRTDVTGGLGGLNTELGGTWPVTVGGNGGAGYVRLESIPRPSVGALGNVFPAPNQDNTGLLRDQDPLSAARTLWLSTRGFAATQSWFTVAALVNGAPVVFSDDPTRGVVPSPGVTPVQVYLQAAVVDPATRQPQPGTQTPWVARAQDLLRFTQDGLRWVVVLDRSVLGPGVPLEVKRVAVELVP